MEFFRKIFIFIFQFVAVLISLHFSGPIYSVCAQVCSVFTMSLCNFYVTSIFHFSSLNTYIFLAIHLDAHRNFPNKKNIIIIKKNRMKLCENRREFSYYVYIKNERVLFFVYFPSVETLKVVCEYAGMKWNRKKRFCAWRK